MKKLTNTTTNYLIQKFTSILIKKGKKALASKIVKKILRAIYEKTNKSPLLVLKKAITKGRPLLWYKFNNKKLDTSLMVTNINKKELVKARVRIYLIKNYDLSIFYFFSWLVSSLSKVDKEKNIVKRISKEVIKLAYGVAGSFILMHKKRMRFVILRKWGKKPFFFRFEKKKTRKLRVYVLSKFYGIWRKSSLFMNRFINRQSKIRFDLGWRFNYLYSKKSKKYLLKFKLTKQNKLYSLFIRRLKKKQIFHQLELKKVKIKANFVLKLRKTRLMVKKIKKSTKNLGKKLKTILELTHKIINK